MRECDVLIVGGGPGGLAAATAAKTQGAKSVIVLERDRKAGGILNQCIHDGFGLIRYKETLTGPEYAYKSILEACNAEAEILLSRHVYSINKNEGTNGHKFIVSAYTPGGIEKYNTKTVILATGCRERTRGNISIPGSRPAGVYTAGVAQNLVNVRNVMIGKRVVILGSGDIGLIMARRLTLEGVRVMAVAEIMSEPTGLARNISQCVYEFNIPIFVRTTVSRIIGKQKLEAVELSELDDRGNVIPESSRIIECDSLVLSVGLIPENEVALSAGVHLMANNSVDTDLFLQTSVPGIFSCGNSRHVMDLADYVSEQGEMAGRNAVHFIKDEPMESWNEEKSNCMKKGFSEEGTVTCTICPNGCQVKLDLVTGECTGNKCLRGAKFAEQERISPMRTVTSTVKLVNGDEILMPVRTAKPIRRELVFNVVERINNMVIKDTFSIGDVVSTVNIDGDTIRVIVT